MGYYASGYGEFIVKPIPEEKLNALRDKYGFEFDYDIRRVPNQHCLSITHDYDKYHDEEVQEVLKELAEYIAEGAFEFSGQDDNFWRYRFCDGKWIEEDGEIVYAADLESQRRKLKDQFACFAKKAFTDSDDLYKNLSSVGLSDGEIKEMGLGFCIPKEETA